MFLLRRAALCAAFLLAAGHCFGQNVSIVRANSYEIGGFVGASYGVDKFRVMGGGNITYAINRYILPYFEYSYFPEIGREITQNFAGSGNAFTAKFTVPVSDFHGGVHIRMPIIRESPVVPYLAIGAGGLRAGKSSFLFESAATTQRIDVAPQTVFAVNGGGGLRFYIGQRWGMRAEGKIYGPFGDFGDTFGKVEFGFFLQLR